MSSNPYNNNNNNNANQGGGDNNYDNNYGDTSNTGYGDSADDSYFGNTTNSGYGGDDTTYGDEQTNANSSRFNEYADEYDDNARYNPGVGERYDTNMDDIDDDDDDPNNNNNNNDRFNEYSDDYDDNARYNPGAGDRYDANRPNPAPEDDEYTASSSGPRGPAVGTRQYNDYDYDSYYGDQSDEDEEQVPLRPSVRSYNFDPNAEFQDEYDSDEDDDYNNRDASFYKGREAYEYRNDEAEEERRIKKVKKRNLRDESLGKKIVAAVCCFCICLITILVLLLVLLVFREDEGASGRNGINGGRGPGGGRRTPQPTPRPTYPIPPALRPALEGRPDILQPWIRVTEEPALSAYPTNVASSNPTNFPTGIPTPKPTISPAPTRPVPPTITLQADADTYIYVDGFFQYEAYGQEQSFLVQNGLAEYYEFADAMGLITFDLSTLPTKVQMLDYDAQAILKMKHLPVNDKFAGRDPATISVRKLRSTPMRVETLHGGIVNREPEGSILGENKFTVQLNQDVVFVDVSDLLYPVNFTDTGYDDDQLFLMLFNNSTEQGDPKWTELEWQDQAGDRFKSVESGEGPSLTITYAPKPANPGTGTTP